MRNMHTKPKWNGTDWIRNGMQMLYSAKEKHRKQTLAVFEWPKMVRNNAYCER